MKTYYRVLTIAGSDSGGGAGVQADMKAISACGCYASSAITAVTVQNTLGVQAVQGLPIDIITGQIRAVLDDIGTDSIKIGMLHSEAVVVAVKETLSSYPSLPIVLDPVMVSTSGHRLIEEEALHALKEQLIPLSRVITPNLPEAEILLGNRALRHQDELADAAMQLGELYQVSVLLKAGHLTSNVLTDYFYDYETGQMTALTSKRIDTRNTHGTGCTLSSALAAMLARGCPMAEAARRAKDYTNQAIREGAEYEIGHGFGPVKHFFRFW